MLHCANHTSCVAEALQNAESICKERGVRFTNIRRKVLQMLWKHHSPAKAYDILDTLSKEDVSARPPTVYRALDFLQENGLVHKINSLNAYVGCSHPLKHDDCYFLICEKCGEIEECCNHVLNDAIEATADKNKFCLKHINVEIEGTCQGCQA